MTSFAPHDHHVMNVKYRMLVSFPTRMRGWGLVWGVGTRLSNVECRMSNVECRMSNVEYINVERLETKVETETYMGMSKHIISWQKRMSNHKPVI